jgi:hypothetical protein
MPVTLTVPTTKINTHTRAQPTSATSTTNPHPAVVIHSDGQQTARRSIGHTQVCTDHIDDRLPVGRVVLCQPLKRIQTTKPDGRLIAAELVDGLAIEIRDTPLDGVALHGACRSIPLRQVDTLQVECKLSGTLPAHCQQQRKRRAGPAGRGQPSTDGISPRLCTHRGRETSTLHPKPPPHPDTDGNNQNRRPGHPPPPQRPQTAGISKNPYSV